MGNGRQMIGKIRREQELCKAEIVTAKDPVKSVVHHSDDSKADAGARARGRGDRMAGLKQQPSR